MVSYKTKRIEYQIKYGLILENWADHDFEKCEKYECSSCGVNDCPFGASEHYWHDGCSYCIRFTSLWKNMRREEIPEELIDAYDLLQIEEVMHS